MKLFHAAASPFVRKAVVLLHELGKAEAVALQNTPSTAFDSNPDLIAANPLARLPALERGDGPTLYDSRVITAYLNEIYGGDFYPQGSSRWDVLTLEATGDGIMDSAVSMVYEKRLRTEEQQSTQWIEAQWAKIARALDVLESRWISHLAGPVHMGQISVGCALGYLDFRLDARAWRDGRPELGRWFDKFAQRPSMQATLPH